MAQLEQMCANERCENTVPAQVGPALCPSCQRAASRLAPNEIEQRIVQGTIPKET
jgi:hypothetical protein